MKPVALAAVMALGIVIALGLGPAACGGRQKGRDDPRAVVIVRVDVADASLWIDGRYRGPIDQKRGGAFPVEAGTHRFEVRQDEHFSHYVELELAPRERRTLEVDLAPILP